MNDSFSKIRKNISQNLQNLPGWITDRKIVVIESDDWGSIRMPSKNVYLSLVSKGFGVSESIYNRLDTLERNIDLTHLYEVLLSFRDSVGNPPVITANMVVGNPDFKRIKQSEFKEYHYEPVTETIKRYPESNLIESLWNRGNSEGIFHPQFHGREHVNIVRWMNALREKSPEIMFTFDNETTFSGNGDYNFMEVLDYNTRDDLVKMSEGLIVGLDLFEEIFGFRSKSFIAPCYTWDSNLEKTLYDNGIRYIQGLMVQSVPTGTFGNYRKKYHFLGTKNSFGLYYLVRNCFFEPSLNKMSDPVGECLRRINIAFRWRKPAVISSHRINFMGSLCETNRSDNLKLFHELLKRILLNWPDVEFLTSDQLGDLIAAGRVKR